MLSNFLPCLTAWCLCPLWIQPGAYSLEWRTVYKHCFLTFFPERVTTLLLHAEWFLNFFWLRRYYNAALWYHAALPVIPSRWDCTSSTASVTDCMAVAGASILFAEHLLDWISQGTAVLLWPVFWLLTGLISQSRAVLGMHRGHMRAFANSRSERQISHKHRH